MNKRELKALCSLCQQSIDEIVEAKNIDMRHSHTVSMDAETSFGDDMPKEAKIIFQCGNRYFDQEINEYFMADDDRKLHPAHNLMVRNICISGNSAASCRRLEKSGLFLQCQKYLRSRFHQEVCA